MDNIASQILIISQIIFFLISHARTLPIDASIKMATLEEPGTLGHPNSKLRPGYGVNFQYRGQILNGLNRYWITTGLLIPSVDWTGMDKLYEGLRCNSTTAKYREVTQRANVILLDRCKSLDKRVEAAMEDERVLRERIRTMLEVEIPALVPRFMDQNIPPAVRPIISKKGHLTSPEVHKMAVARQPLIWMDDQTVSIMDVYKAFHDNRKDYPINQTLRDNDWAKKNNKKTIDLQLPNHRYQDTPVIVQGKTPEEVAASKKHKGKSGSRVKRQTAGSMTRLSEIHTTPEYDVWELLNTNENWSPYKKRDMIVGEPSLVTNPPLKSVESSVLEESEMLTSEQEVVRKRLETILARTITVDEFLNQYAKLGDQMIQAGITGLPTESSEQPRTGTRQNIVKVTRTTDMMATDNPETSGNIVSRSKKNRSKIKPKNNRSGPKDENKTRDELAGTRPQTKNSSTKRDNSFTRETTTTRFRKTTPPTRDITMGEVTPILTNRQRHQKKKKLKESKRQGGKKRKYNNDQEEWLTTTMIDRGTTKDQVNSRGYDTVNTNSPGLGMITPNEQSLPTTNAPIEEIDVDVEDGEMEVKHFPDDYGPPDNRPPSHPKGAQLLECREVSQERKLYEKVDSEGKVLRLWREERSPVTRVDEVRRSRKIRRSTRHKRSVAAFVAAIKIGWPIAKLAYTAVKRTVKYFKSLRQKRLYGQSVGLLKRMPSNDQRIERLEKDLASLARVTHAEHKRFQHQLKIQSETIDYLANAYIPMMQLYDDFQVISSRTMSLLQGMLQATENLATGIDMLLQGHLSHHVLTQPQLETMLKYVRFDLESNYPQYTRAFPNTAVYYTQPITRVSRVGDMVVFQFPVYVRHYQEVPMDLYQMTVIPVPYQSDLAYPLENEYNPYTMVRMSHDMLAMTEETNMPYNSQDLDLCMEVNQIHYCENLHLVQIETEPSCASAIYYDIDPLVIKEKCHIAYYHKYKPEPTLLDGGNEILIAGVPDMWEVECDKDRDIPMRLQAGPYVIIKRSELCQCSLQAGDYFLHESLTTCIQEHQTSMQDPVQYYFTLNTAAVVGLGTEIPTIHQNRAGMLEYQDTRREEVLTGSMLSITPYEAHMAQMTVLDDEWMEDGVLEVSDESNPVSYSRVLELIMEGHGVYETEGAKALANRDMVDWFTPHGHHWMAVLFILAILGGITAIGLACTTQKWRGIQTSFKGKALQIAQHAMIQQALENIPGAYAAPSRHTEVVFRFTMETVTTFVAAQIVVFIILALFAHLMTRILMYLWSDYLERPTQFVWRTWFKRVFTFHDTEVLLQLSSLKIGQTKQLYVKTIPGHPTKFDQKGTLKVSRMKLKQSWWNDVLVVPWPDILLTYEGEILVFNPKIYVPFVGKWNIRRLIDEEETTVRIILLRANNYVILESSGDPPKPVRPATPSPNTTTGGGNRARRLSAYSPLMSTLEENLESRMEGRDADLQEMTELSPLTSFRQQKGNILAQLSKTGLTGTKSRISTSLAIPDLTPYTATSTESVRL